MIHVQALQNETSKLQNERNKAVSESKDSEESSLQLFRKLCKIEQHFMETRDTALWMADYAERFQNKIGPTTGFSGNVRGFLDRKSVV